MANAPRKSDLKLAEKLVASYVANLETVHLFQGQILLALQESTALREYVHSIRARTKDPDHLRDKLLRKMQACRLQQTAFTITAKSLLGEINDLAGIRILHLHTRQIQDIDRIIRAILTEQRFELLEGPSARTWDLEYSAFFSECGIATQDSPTMYTSVHYVVASASRTRVTCEIQVRTLMEEVWGEVDHRLKYPVPSTSLACREQLKVLARVTSSATRLVDSIFLTATDHDSGA